jgi:hypothetical protein
MQKWEFLVVQGEYLENPQDNIRLNAKMIAVRANGISLKPKGTTGALGGPPFPDLFEFLNQLGEHGWEIVSSEGGLLFTLKRLKPKKEVEG